MEKISMNWGERQNLDCERSSKQYWESGTEALTQRHKQSLPRGLATGDTDSINQHSQWFRLVTVFFFKGRWQAAFYFFFNTCKRKPKKPVSYHNLGFILPVSVSKCLFVIQSTTFCLLHRVCSEYTSLPTCLRSMFFPFYVTCLHLNASQIEANDIIFAFLIICPSHTHMHLYFTVTQQAAFV